MCSQTTRSERSDKQKGNKKMTNTNEQTLSTLEERVRTALETISPAPIGTIVSTLSDEAETEVKAAVVSLINKNAIQKIGKKRGTKYCTLDFDPSQLAQKTPQYNESIVSALTTLGPRTPLKKIAENLGKTPEELRESLNMLMESSVVVKHGEKRGACYSLAGMDFAEEVKAPKKTKKEAKADSTSETDETARDFDSFESFVEAALEHLPSGKEFDIASMTDRMMKAMPRATVEGKAPTAYEVTNHLVAFAKAGKVHTESRKNDEGQRVFYSRQG